MRRSFSKWSVEGDPRKHLWPCGCQGKCTLWDDRARRKRKDQERSKEEEEWPSEKEWLSKEEEEEECSRRKEQGVIE